MRKLLIIVGVFLCLFFIYKRFFPQQVSQSLPSKPTSTPTQISLTPFTHPLTESIFVPYWTIDKNILPQKFDTAIYFGVTATTNGIDTEEDGYKKIVSFFHMIPSKTKTFLTIRLLSSDINQKFVNDITFQKIIIQQSLALAKEKGFSGIVVDFEYNALAFPSVVTSITKAMQNFEQQAHTAGLSYYQAFYGDNFYRLRPYDTAAIAKNADGVFILAYDLHKANGDPGPNFPLTSTNDYTFSQMVNDFSQQIHREKITVVFGMFGYDWVTGSQGKSSQQATSRSFLDIQNHFLTSCSFTFCHMSSQSSGTKITYEENNENHVIWIDTSEILKKKKQFLLQQGIGNFSYWAYSYF